MSKRGGEGGLQQTEGDPHIKARLRQLRMRARAAADDAERAQGDGGGDEPDPLRRRAALRVRRDRRARSASPRASDLVALKIREVAEDAGVPVIEDPPLARALYATVEIDETIPREHYEAVAKVIGFVMQPPSAGGRADDGRDESRQDLRARKCLGALSSPD